MASYNWADRVDRFRSFLAEYSAGEPEDYSDWNEFDIFPEFQNILAAFDEVFGVKK